MSTTEKKLSANDWDYIRDQTKQLISGQIKIRFDDFAVTFQIRHETPTKGYIKVYVNEWFRGEWMLPENSCPESQFLRRREYPLYKKAERARLEKILGKRKLKLLAPNIDAVHVQFEPTFPSWRAALAHIKQLEKQFTTVELMREAE